MAKMSFEAGSNLKRNLRQKRWLLGLFIFLLASLLVINSFTISQFQIVGNNTNQVTYVQDSRLKVYQSAIKKTAESPEPQAQEQQQQQPKVQKGYVVSNAGCRIPDLSPFEASAMRYFDKAKPIVCEHGTQLPLVSSNASAIYVDPEARPSYYNDTESVECCWRTFWRADPKDNKVTYSKDCHFFEDVAYINDEFVRVECQVRNGSIYLDYFAFVPRKLRVESRCRKQLRLEKFLATSKRRALTEKRPINETSASATDTRNNNNDNNKNNNDNDNDGDNSYKSNNDHNDKKLSVLIVGVDSVSRLNFHRLMPRTLGLLKGLGAVELYGYNKVADNTYPNVVPVLSGRSVKEFERLCWNNHDEPFDKCPLIWNKFAARGYRTIFGEDACWMAIFNYLKPGFRKAPTDYYLRPFCYEAESTIGNTHKYNAHLCVGTRLTFNGLLGYTRKVAEEFADDPYFGFFWQASLTHDSIEYPQLGDDSYHEFLAYLRDNELLRNTALIFMSDHGMRWGSFRQTYQGRLEDSLPFVFFVFPEWWKALYPEAYMNLQNNARSLTSPFDLHETLKDILEPDKLILTRASPLTTTSAPPLPQHSEEEMNYIPNSTTEKMKDRRDKLKPVRGISLFKPIPDDRTCDTAGIPEHWCMCQNRYNVSHQDPMVLRVLSALVSEINLMLTRYPQCAQLEVSRLIEANALSHNPTTSITRQPSTAQDDKKSGKKKSYQQYWTDYSLTLEMSPGGAVFEASIRYRAQNNSLSLIDSISRLNAYGNQSACVDDFHMRLYCYCLNQPS